MGIMYWDNSCSKQLLNVTKGFILHLSFDKRNLNTSDALYWNKSVIYEYLIGDDVRENKCSLNNLYIGILIQCLKKH
jgi:hypothetical protein